MKTFDVTLPINKQVIFPARCVVCEKPNPDGMIKLSFLGANSASLTQIMVDKALDLNVDPKYYGSNTLNRIEGIPACQRCESNLKWYHRLLKVGYYTAWMPGMALFFLPIPVFITTIIMIMLAISPGLFTLVYPPSFGASFFNGQANFEFKSQKIAEEFLKLNTVAKLNKTETKVKANTSSSSPSAAG